MVEMSAEKKLNSWLDGVFTRYCLKCPTTCCNGSRHPIIFSYADDLSKFFGNAGVNVYDWEELNPGDVVRWWNHFPSQNYPKEIRNREGFLIPQPSIIQLPVNIRAIAEGGEEVPASPYYASVLYVHETCPFYDAEMNGCSVHDQPRPKVCGEYPLIYSKEEGKLVIGIKKGCYINSHFDELEKEFEETFPEGEYLLRADVEGGKVFR